MKAYFDAEQFMGTVLVAEKGKIVYENGFGFANREWEVPNRPEGVFNIASITKRSPRTLTLRLVQEGKLKLDDKISDFLPYYRKDIGGKVTIHHLLTHSSGIPNFVGMPGFLTSGAREPMGKLEDFIKKYCSRDLDFEPGTTFNYNNSGYVILGAIIEKASGMTFEEALRDRILGPCGMTRSGLDYNHLSIPKKMTGYVRKLDGSLEIAPYWDRTWTFCGRADVFLHCRPVEIPPGADGREPIVEEISGDDVHALFPGLQDPALRLRMDHPGCSGPGRQEAQGRIARGGHIRGQYVFRCASPKKTRSSCS